MSKRKIIKKIGRKWIKLKHNKKYKLNRLNWKIDNKNSKKYKKSKKKMKKKKQKPKQKQKKRRKYKRM